MAGPRHRPRWLTRESQARDREFDVRDGEFYVRDGEFYAPVSAGTAAGLGR
ncbi:hypothetical protein SAMN05421810_102924 [Amycolatopsis arida]|uniref:Uncharacterized protein n=1 Tax=Amycolatopsis arida TaxID=587909 RepID=A0A1I5R8K3_9PSEU|nr:hypothetical protein CLV69_101925 [Amycolatopsis arida]SFP54864.1 hypothetical protein SAMN05421810_102924 [Amycolatopsis arida]